MNPLFKALVFFMALSTTYAKNLIKSNINNNFVLGYISDSGATYPGIVANMPSLVVKINDPISMNISALFISEVPLTYHQNGLPDGCSLDSATGIIAGNPTTIGIQDVTVSASDGEDTIIANKFKIIVTYPSGIYPSTSPTPFSVSSTASPSLSTTNSASISPIASGAGPAVLQVLQNQVIVAGIAFSIDCAASFVDSAGVVWYASELPDGASLDSSTGTVSGTVDTPGMYEITIFGAVNGSLHTRSSPFYLIVCNTDGSYPAV